MLYSGCEQLHAILCSWATTTSQHRVGRLGRAGWIRNGVKIELGMGCVEAEKGMLVEAEASPVPYPSSWP